MLCLKELEILEAVSSWSEVATRRSGTAYPVDLYIRIHPVHIRYVCCLLSAVWYRVQHIPNLIASHTPYIKINPARSTYFRCPMYLKCLMYLQRGHLGGVVDLWL